MPQSLLLFFNTSLGVALLPIVQAAFFVASARAEWARRWRSGRGGAACCRKCRFAALLQREGYEDGTSGNPSGLVGLQNRVAEDLLLHPNLLHSFLHKESPLCAPSAAFACSCCRVRCDSSEDVHCFSLACVFTSHVALIFSSVRNLKGVERQALEAFLRSCV